MKSLVAEKIQELVDLETKGWDTKNIEYFLSIGKAGSARFIRSCGRVNGNSISKTGALTFPPKKAA